MEMLLEGLFGIGLSVGCLILTVSVFELIGLGVK